jgi:hypothetical protein
LPDFVSPSAAEDISRQFTVATLEQPAIRLPESAPAAAWRAYNPSLALHGTKLLLAFRVSTMTRCGRARIDYGEYYSGARAPFRNWIGVAALDPATLALSDAALLDATIPDECAWSLGHEDPRILVVDGRLFIVATHRNSKWTFELTLIELGAGRKIVREVRIVPDVGADLHQKNWNPFVLDGELFFVSSIVPHKVYRVDVETGRATLVSETTTSAFGDLETEHDIRGGAGYFRERDTYVGICRTALRQDPDQNTNDYACVAYAFDAAPPFAISRRSAPFTFASNDHTGRPIQMATGIAEVGREVFVSFGENDCDLRIARIDRDILLRAVGGGTSSD